MKRLILLTLLLLSISAFSQYQVKSPYLLNPSLTAGYVDSCAKFWKKAYDPTLGGFYTNLDKSGNIQSTNQKCMQTQSRDAYGFVRAYMLTGDTTYIDMARAALNFMYAHAWDNQNGGWFWELDKNGTPTLGNTNKDAFHQHYALLGPVAFYETMRDTNDLNWIIKGFNNNENKMWDSRPDYFGYYDYCSKDWSTKNNKSFNSTVDAITTHLLHMYLLTGQQQYQDRMMSIADNMLNHLVSSMNNQQIGFAEICDAQWNPISSETMTIMGHVLKTAWCFCRAYEVNPDTNFIAAAKKLFNAVYTKGYDKELGGPYKDFNRTTGQMLMWGLADTCKAWWQMEQAVTSGLFLYKITNDPFYLKVADESLDFFMKYFVDHVNGEVYENRTRYGGLAWNESKGNPNKAGYHSIETGYYTYLYGSFFYKKQAVSLYYYFTPYNTERTYNLTPVEIPTVEYKITGISYNNQPYTNFNADARNITLPAGTGGKFKVTFDLTGISSVAENTSLPKNFTLNQNYPNPFNPSTTISWNVPEESNIRIAVYNMLGQEVTRITEGIAQAGTYKSNFNAGTFSSGVYICRMEGKSISTGKQFTSSIKMLLIK
jgi:mannose/cellobiose epimerase-like protein (N-acyl-D-glucosamine 2-epimerase family)